MKKARKDLKQGASKQEERQSIAQVVSLRSSNQIEIVDAKEENSLALFNFPESMCIRRAVTQQERSRKRRRVRERGMCEILPDVLTEILVRLPAKSMVRFKCVSKQWSSLISCRYFCNRVFATVTRQQPRLYMCLVDEDDSQLVLLSISSTSPDNTCYVVDQDLTIPGMGGFFLNVARGLMCFSRIEKACIYNPSTKQLLTLPAIKSDIIAQQGQEKHHVVRYYIGHDPVSDQYKLVCTIAISSPRPRLANLKSEHWVFALEAGGSWKKVVPLENYRHHAPSPLGRSTSGSVVHYMAWPNNYNCVVVSFDIRSEQLTIIPVPREIAVHEDVPAVTMKADLIDYGGKIAIFYHTYLKDMSSAALWILEDSVKNEWSNQNLVLQPPQRHLVQDIELIVRGTTQDGKVILAPVKMHSRFYVLYYDLQSNDLRKVEIKGVPSLWLDKRCYFDLNYMDESESVIYLET